jgi:predicted extracellular nuclease
MGDLNSYAKEDPINAIRAGPDGSFTYIPDPGFLGVDYFTYDLIAIPPGMVRGEYVDTATVTITVHPKYRYFLPIFFND